MNSKEAFANNLKYYMAKNEKGRRQVCDDLDINYYTFADWVNAKKMPRTNSIEKLANYFGIIKSDLTQTRHKNKVIVNIAQHEAVNFGAVITSAREASNMSVEQLADMLDETPERIHEYEDSTVFPLQHLKRLHEAIGLSYYDLLGIKRLYNPLMETLYKLDLSTRQLRQVIDYAEYIKAKQGDK